MTPLLQRIPRRWRIASLIWATGLLSVLIFLFARNSDIDEAKAGRFYKEKEARRGKIRKAKEGKESLSFSQERFNVTRACFLDDPGGIRRQFFLEAIKAEISSTMIHKKQSVKELFSSPKGWFQEELFFEVASTGEKVLKKDDTWVSASPPYRPIASRFYRDVVPVQQVRFFDAETAEWTLETNELVAHTAFFAIIKAPGHDLPSHLGIGKTLSKGTAQAITFSFDKKGRQVVKSEGVKLHLGDTK